MLLLVFFFLLLPLASFAQQKIELAPVASFDFGSPLFINRAEGILNSFGGTGSGTSSSTSYGVGLEARGPEWIAPHLDLIGRVEAVYTTGHFTFDSIPSTISGSEAKLLFEAGAGWNLAPISLDVGPWISQAIVRTISETNGTPSNANSSYTHAGLGAGVAWDIPNFALRPELNTHLDLTELSQAGANAWSFGISLSYHVGSTAGLEEQAAMNSAPRDTSRGEAPPQVKFLVDGAEVRGNPPLDREELHVTQYTMADAPNTSPTVEHWIKRSYHLPQLSILYSEKGPGTLRVASGTRELLRKQLDDTSPGGTKIEPLRDSEWQHNVLQLNSADTNLLIAELLLDAETLRDTLVFPPADSSAASTVITKHESRFRLLTNYAHNTGGKEVLELLLQRMQALLEENPAITITAPSQHLPLFSRLQAALGDRWNSATVTEAPGSPYVTVVFDY